MICNEEKLLVNVLYKTESESLQGIDIINVNFENLMKLASNHLMLPALFFNINKKNLSHLFPVDFIECIKKVYLINKARNEVLLKEAKELSELLYKDNINHIFLKGTALLLSNVFEDIGERMMCDIDFIIQHKDEKKIKNLLEANNYYTNNDYSIVNLFRINKPKHLPRQININKTIGIEPHLELLSPKSRYVFNSKNLITDFEIEAKIIKTPNKSFLFDHCIYALQIEDRRILNSNHSHRSIYDIYKLDCKNSSIIKKIKKDVYIKHFFSTIDKFKIFKINTVSSLSKSFIDQLFSFISIRSFKYLIIIDNYLNKFSIIINLFFNNMLREKALKKITKNYKNKTLLNYMYAWLKSY